MSRTRLKLVLFTATPHFDATEWWPHLARADRVERVLIVQFVPQPGLRAVIRRLRANIRKHGPIFIPYRIVMAVIGIGRRMASMLRRDPATAPIADVSSVPFEVIAGTNIHAPEVLDAVRQWAPDLGVSIGAPILRAPLFTIPPMGTLNLHLGRVPEFRGAPPGFWELYQGSGAIGATVHWIDVGLDTGAIIAEESAAIYPEDSLEDVEARAHELGRGVLAEAMTRVLDGDRTARPQPAGGTTNRMPTVTTRTRLSLRLTMRSARRVAGRPVLLAKNIAAVLALAVIRPIRDVLRSIMGTHPVRIFTYHRVTELCRDGMTVSPRVFEEQIRFLARTHEIVSVDDALDLLESNARLRRPVAVITFDDAYASVWGAAAPVLAAARAPATVFVSTALVGNDRRFEHDAQHPLRRHFGCMTWEQLDALHRAGWTLGAHTVNHARLSACSGEALRTEVRGPLETLKSRAGANGAAFAFPFGQASDISDAARDEMRAAGYRGCCSNFGGDNLPGAALPFELRRIDLGSNHTGLAWRCLAHGIDLQRFKRAR